MATLYKNGTEIARVSKDYGTHVKNVSIRSNGWMLVKRGTSWKRLDHVKNLPGVTSYDALLDRFKALGYSVNMVIEPLPPLSA